MLKILLVVFAMFIVSGCDVHEQEIHNDYFPPQVAPIKPPHPANCDRNLPFEDYKTCMGMP